MTSPNLVTMSAIDWAAFILYFTLLFSIMKPLGLYMADVYMGNRTFLSGLLGPVERLFYRLSGVARDKGMTWRQYVAALLLFSAASFAGLYVLLRLQHRFLLPGETLDDKFSPSLAFNTAVSFVSNTNWQAYTPEKTIGLLTQMTGLTVQNFLSAAVGMAVMAALARGFAQKQSETIGNFWVDLTRGVLYILLPLSLILGGLLVSQGVVQTFSPRLEATRLLPIPQDQRHLPVTTQEIPLGPVASQVAIKQLGTNGGGYYAANSAHPFENPTPLSNLLEMLAILLIPGALCFTFGKMIGQPRQGRAMLMAMTLIFIPLVLACIHFEKMPNPFLGDLNLSTLSTCNMEGKETRFGCMDTALWAAATTASSNGSVNGMLDSFMPLGGLVPLVLIQFSDVVFGGVGTGLCAMILFVIMTVFITGLMVGRTPELLNKKIGAFQVKMVCLAILTPHIAALIGTALAVSIGPDQAGTSNPFAQGFSQVLYAFSSASNNNGSAFAGLHAGVPFYNVALALVMLCARYGFIVPLLALAGSLAEAKSVPANAGTLDTTSPLFVFVLIGIIILVGVLTFVPALALGPVAEHFHLYSLSR